MEAVESRQEGPVGWQVPHHQLPECYRVPPVAAAPTWNMAWDCSWRLVGRLFRFDSAEADPRSCCCCRSYWAGYHPPLMCVGSTGTFWTCCTMQCGAARALTTAIALTSRGLSTTIALQKGRLYEDVPDLEERPPKGPEPSLNFLTARMLRSLCRTLTSSRGLMPSHENECRLNCLAG